MILQNKKTTFLLLSLLITISLVPNQLKTESVDPFFTLVAKCGSSEGMDVLFLVQQQLARIGINLDIERQDWPTYIAELIAFRDFDLIYIDDWRTPDPFYNIKYPDYFYDCIEDYNGTLNIFGYFYGMDWNEEMNAGMNEAIQSSGGNMTPPISQERIDLSWEWQHYIMDEILPFLPMFVSKTYVQFWDGLEGYSYSDGLLQSWGKMSWYQSHPGQTSTSEIVIADYPWENLNPLIHTDKLIETQEAEEFIAKAVMDSLFWIDPNNQIWPHLVSSWEHLSDTHLQLNLRENVPWQVDSDGLFTTEYFDSKDVYFTLYCMKEMNNEFNWMKNFTIIDDHTLDIVIDIDSYTPGDQYYNLNYFEKLVMPILPEHYLNQSQLVDGITPDTSHQSWETFSETCFGTGLFEISVFEPGIATTLTQFPDCWLLEPTLSTDESLNLFERFGNFTGGLNQLRIRQLANKQARKYEFESGKIDLYEFSDLRELWRSDWFICLDKEIQTKLTDSMSLIGFNMREVRPVIGSLEPTPMVPEKSKGLAIRKAISYAINRDEINNILFANERKIISSPLHPSMGVWVSPEMISYCHNLGAARDFIHIPGYDIAWCGPSEPIEWPEWDTLCSGTTSIPTSISVNGISFIATITILASMSGIIFLRNRLKATRKKKKC